jgi:hypothetical protein
MSLTKSEIKKMQDEKACPTCGKRLTAMEVDHLAAGNDNTETSESFRPGQAFAVDADGNLRTLRLSESGGSAEHERAIEVFESFGLNRQGAEAAAGRQRR